MASFGNATALVSVTLHVGTGMKLLQKSKLRVHYMGGFQDQSTIPRTHVKLGQVVDGSQCLGARDGRAPVAC